MLKVTLLILFSLLVSVASFSQTVKSVRLGSNTVTGGLPDTGTVTISADAKTGGLKVSLKSNSDYAVVPASVTVPSGSNTATFPIATSVVPAKEQALMTASANGSAASAELTIVPPVVTALAIVPTSVICQESATGTVTINVGAGPSGFKVALKSDQLCASVPAAVTVPTGATTVSFTVSTSIVTQSTVATITATGGGGTATATFTVLPGNGLSPSGWSKFLANAGNTPQGLRPSAKGQIAMKVDVFSGPHSPPAVGPDGTVYAIESTYDVKLRALTPGGSTKWTIEFPAPQINNWPMPLVGPDGTVYTLIGSNLYAVSPLGKIRWNRAAGSYPAIDSHGVLYIGNTGGEQGISVSALASDGSVKWTTSVPGAAQPTVGHDGNIYVGSTVGLTKLTPGYVANPKGGMYAFSGGILVSLAFNGTKLWVRSLPEKGGYDGPYAYPGELMVDSAGDVYAQDGIGKLWALTSTGAVKWSCQLGDGALGSLARGINGEIYVSSFGELTASASGSSLYAVSSLGAIQWAHYGTFIFSVPSFGLDGTAYFAGGGGLSAFDASGNLKWTLGNGNQHNYWDYWGYWNDGWSTQPTVGSDGTIYYWSYDGFRAVTATGKPKWFYPYTHSNSPPQPYDQEMTPAIGPDGTIYFADRNLYALNPDGTLKWSKSYADWLMAICPLVTQSGTLYVISQGQTGPQAIYAIAPDGKLIATTVQAAPWETISLDSKGNLYTIVYNVMCEMNPGGQITQSFGGSTSTWFVVAADGTVCYRDSTSNDIVLDGGFSMGSDWDPFAMASADTIYGVTQTGGTVRAYSNGGVLLWSLPGVSAWTAQYTLFPGISGYRNSADRPLTIAPNGNLWVFSGYGFVVIK
jgi:hypothetical protein